MPASDTGSNGTDDASDVDSDEALGLESSGLDSDESEANRYLSADSNEVDGDEVEDDAGGDTVAVAVDDGARTDEGSESDDGISCALCGGTDLAEEVNEHTDGLCDVCDRNLGIGEAVLSCTRESCEFDICRPCAGFGRSTSRHSAGPSAPPPPAPPPPSHPVALASTGATAATAQVAAALDPMQRQLADLSARIRERARRSSQPPQVDAFLDWQAARAAERRGEPPPDASRTGRLAGLMGEQPDDAAPEVAGAIDATDAQTAQAGTPATGGYTLATPANVTILPEERIPLDEQVGSLVAGGGEALQLAIKFARELFRQLPSAALADAADGVYGDLGADDMYAQSGDAVVEGRPAANGPPLQFQVALPQQRQTLTGVTVQQRCLCCDERGGQGDSNVCSALQLYDSLIDDLRDRDRIIAQEQADGSMSLADLRRGARWFMYRTFVHAQYGAGALGAGVRVRIPDCVVAAIRSRYRAPGCNCAVCDIAHCQAHGYTGYRDSQ